MIKPAYSVSFLLSINIFVWQNVLYFLDAPHIPQTEKVSFQLFSAPLINSVIIIRNVIITTLQIKGTLNTPTFYYSYKTKAQLLGSWLKQWNLLEKSVRVSFYRNRQSHIAMYCSMDSELV